jgi:hypothetical protein
MLHTKVFSATVDVADVCNFCADKDRHLMAALHDRFAGRCFGGCFVMDILKVLKASACHLVRTNSSGEGYIDVEFLAQVTVFCRWDILVGVKILNHQPMLIGVYGSTDTLERPLAPLDQAGGLAKPCRAVVTARGSKAVETLAVGQLAAVRIIACEHPPMKDHAAVVGVLLTCDNVAPVYKIRGGLDQAARVELAPILDAVEKELLVREELIKTRRADFWFFESLLFAFREGASSKGSIPSLPETLAVPTWDGGPVWEGPVRPVPANTGELAENIVAIVHRVVRGGETVPVAGTWSRPLSVHRSSPLAAVVRGKDAVSADWAPAVESTPRAVFAEFLKNILDFLVAVRELVQVYSTKEMIEKHYNLWSAMRAAQKPLDSVALSGQGA